MSKEERKAFNVKQCRGVNERTGEPCRQPALKGGDYCRFHQEKPNQEKPGGTGDDFAGPEDTTDEKRRGGKPDNQNVTWHGPYSLQLLPEEGAFTKRNEQASPRSWANLTPSTRRWSTCSR